MLYSICLKKRLTVICEILSGTLLLQIGEMGCVVQSFDDFELSDDSLSISSQSTKSPLPEDKPSSSTSDSNESKNEIVKHSDNATLIVKSDDSVQKDWSITFKQFQGTLYTQQFLISQFDQKINICSEIEHYRKRCFEKMMTS